MLTRLKLLINQARAHQGFRRYSANTSWLIAEQMLRMVAGLLVGVWVARHLGPEQYGVLSYALTFAALFGSIAKLGLDGVVVRDLVSEPGRGVFILGTAFWLKLAGSLVMMLAVAAAVQLSSSDSQTKWYVLIIAAGLIFQSFEVLDFYFQSKVLAKFISVSKLTQLLVSSLLKVYLVLTDAGLSEFVMVSLLDQILLAMALLVAYRLQNTRGFYLCFDPRVAKRMLRDGWPLTLSGLVVMVYMRIDQIMIKEMLGDKEAGLYAAAVRLSEVWYFVPLLVTKSLFPSFVEAKKVSERLYHARLQRLFIALVWMSIIVAVPMTFVSDRLVALLYGPVYQEAGQVLMVHVWGGVFVSLGVASGSWYITEGLQRLAFYRTALGAVINVALNLLFIPKFGLIGAAVATVIAQFSSALFFDVLTEKTRFIFIMKMSSFNLANLIAKGVKCLK